MRYLLDKDKRLLGFSEKCEGLFTETPPLPFGAWKEAVFEGDSWRYKFNSLVDSDFFHNHAVSLEKRSAMLLNSILFSFVSCRGGNKTKPKSGGVSVLVPCFGKARYVESAVRSAAFQTMPPQKIIVLLMDAQSRALKKTLESIADNVECVESERLSCCESRNRLVELCPTEHFVFLDADDVLNENFLAVLWSLPANTAFAAYRDISEDGVLLSQKSDSAFPFSPPANILRGNCTGLWCKEAFNALGGFDNSMSRGGEDADLLIRLLAAEEWRVDFVPTPLWRYRRRADNSLSSKTGFYEGHLELLRKHKLWFLSELKKNADFSVSGGILDFLSGSIDQKKCSDFYIKQLADISTLAKAYSNAFAFALEQSRLKTPISAYDKEAFVLAGNVKDADFSLSAKTAFDVLFSPSADGIPDVNNMVINKTVLAQAKETGLSGDSLALWLCENFCCVMPFFNRSQNPNSVRVLNFYDVNNAPLNTCKAAFRISPRHRITIVLDKRCNKNCEYCYQLQDADRNLVLSDEEWLERFDAALAKAREVYGDVKIQIMGGEPGLWSDRLVSSIQSRMKPYSMYEVFTNGTNPQSLWYKDKKAELCLHVTDWRSLPLLPQDYGSVYAHYVVLVKPGETKLLEKFLRKNSHLVFFVLPTSSSGVGECVSCENDLRAIADVCRECGNTDVSAMRYVDTLDSEGLLENQSKCRNMGSITTFQCGTMTVIHCNGKNAKIEPVSDFDGQDFNCGNCMWFFTEYKQTI